MKTHTQSALGALALVAVLLAVFSFAQADINFPININSGGGSLFDRSMNNWTADGYYEGGQTTISSLPVWGTTDQAIYRNARTGTFSYTLPNVKNGTYTIVLKFAEFQQTPIGSRVFDVVINGNTVLSRFDIVKESGFVNWSLDKTVTASVTDGSLKIEFKPIVGEAQVNGIQIRFDSPAATLPTTPSAPTLSVTGGTMKNSLSWTASTDDKGVAGYRVFRDGVQIATTSSTKTIGIAYLSESSATYNPNWKTDLLPYKTKIENGLKQITGQNFNVEFVGEYRPTDLFWNPAKVAFEVAPDDPSWIGQKRLHLFYPLPTSFFGTTDNTVWFSKNTVLWSGCTFPGCAELPSGNPDMRKFSNIVSGKKNPLLVYDLSWLSSTLSATTASAPNFSSKDFKILLIGKAGPVIPSQGEREHYKFCQSLPSDILGYNAGTAIVIGENSLLRPGRFVCDASHSGGGVENTIFGPTGWQVIVHEILHSYFMSDVYDPGFISSSRAAALALETERELDKSIMGGGWYVFCDKYRGEYSCSDADVENLRVDKYNQQRMTEYVCLTSTDAAGNPICFYDLNTSAAHTYTVDAFDADGNFSAKSNTLSSGSSTPTPPIEVPPTPPTNPPTGSCDPVANAFVGCYYPNLSFSGTAALSRTDPAINFDWSESTPHSSLAADNYSVRWQGNFDFQGGTYVFSPKFSGTLRVKIDGLSFISRWRSSAAGSQMSFTKELSAGIHSLIVEYVPDGDPDSAAISLSWTLRQF